MSDRWKNKKERPGLTLVPKKFNLSRRAQESFQNFKKIIHYYMFFLFGLSYIGDTIIVNIIICEVDSGLSW